MLYFQASFTETEVPGISQPLVVQEPACYDPDTAGEWRNSTPEYTFKRNIPLCRKCVRYRHQTKGIVFMMNSANKASFTSSIIIESVFVRAIYVSASVVT